MAPSRARNDRKAKKSVKNKPAKSPTKPRKSHGKRGRKPGKSGSKAKDKAPKRKEERVEEKEEPTTARESPLKTPKNNLEGFFGLRGPNFLHKALTTCNDPNEMLQQFRAEEGILVPTLRPAVALLDLMDVRRYDFHMLCAEQLRQALMDRITSASKVARGEEKQRQLEALLDQCFVGLNLPLVRPIVLHVLGNLDTVADRYKKEIMNNKELYDVCDVPLRRQIWLDRKDLFEAEMFPLFDEWIAGRRKSMFELNTTSSLYSIPGNIRRQDPSLVKMVANIGDSVPLYGFVVDLIKSRYLSSGSPHYGTLRLDLLILLHESQPQIVNKADGFLYKFSYCMDACVRARHVDAKRCKEITDVLDILKRKDFSVFRDIAMILGEPQITYFNATSAMRLVQAVINQDGLPRDNNMLMFFMRLLGIGTHARDYVTEQLQKEAKLSAEICCTFLPKLCSVIVSVAARKVHSENVKTATLSLDALLPSLKREPVAVWLVLQWIAYLLRQNDQDLVQGLFAVFPQFVEKMPLGEEHLVHSVVMQLARTTQERVWSQAFADCIFRTYLASLDGKINGALHALWLMYYVYPKLEPRYRDAILQDILPQVDGNPEVKALFTSVSGRISTSVPLSPMLLDTSLTPDFRSPDHVSSRPHI
ncbi:Negative elongation factor B [Hypsibius exemplaris]|uniref:Negative elongation factor B n=1 Tax=Hypsibius exemplaris TaxID=2072580 RepID=A0A1W0WAH2_HYPEX|nr:Negative elongation factor B [Hypsibius exemplaris]